MERGLLGAFLPPLLLFLSKFSLLSSSSCQPNTNRQSWCTNKLLEAEAGLPDGPGIRAHPALLLLSPNTCLFVPGFLPSPMAPPPPSAPTLFRSLPVNTPASSSLRPGARLSLALGSESTRLWHHLASSHFTSVAPPTAPWGPRGHGPPSAASPPCTCQHSLHVKGCPVLPLPLLPWETQ